MLSCSVCGNPLCPSLSHRAEQGSQVSQVQHAARLAVTQVGQGPGPDLQQGHQAGPLGQTGHCSRRRRVVRQWAVGSGQWAVREIDHTEREREKGTHRVRKQSDQIKSGGRKEHNKEQAQEGRGAGRAGSPSPHRWAATPPRSGRGLWRRCPRPRGCPGSTPTAPRSAKTYQVRLSDVR